VEKSGNNDANLFQRIARGKLIQGQVAGISLILIVGCVALSVFTPTFLTSTNIFNILRAFSWIAIAAFGECMVIITGGIDLSVGSTMGLSGIISAMMMAAGIPVSLSVIGGLLTGCAVGLLNGLMITKAKLPPFIATLGMLLMARGMCYGLTRGWPVMNLPQSFGVFAIDIPVLGVPVPLIFVLVLALVVGMFLSRTIWGYRIYAVGGNEESAALSGIGTDRVKIMVYVIAGLLAAIGGILMTSRLGVASPMGAYGYELDVIAAAVVGGTSLAGGEGTILGVLIGAVIMQVLRTGLVLIGVSAYWLQAIQGLVIVVAITLDQLRKRRR
jgi:ribose transport system permease protein